MAKIEITFGENGTGSYNAYEWINIIIIQNVFFAPYAKSLSANNRGPFQIRTRH